MEPSGEVRTRLGLELPACVRATWPELVWRHDDVMSTIYDVAAETRREQISSTTDRFLLLLPITNQRVELSTWHTQNRATYATIYLLT